MIFQILLYRSVQTPNSDENWQTLVCNISRHLEFIIEQGHRVCQLGLRVAGFLGHWVAGSQNVTQFRLWYLSYRFETAKTDPSTPHYGDQPTSRQSGLRSAATADDVGSKQRQFHAGLGWGTAPSPKSCLGRQIYPQLLTRARKN